MKRVSKSLFATALVLCMLFALSVNASAASIAEQDGLKVTIATDKETYAQGNEIQVSISVENTTNHTISGVSIETLLPDGLNIKTSGLTGNNITISAGDTYTAAVTVEHTPTEPKPTEPKPTEPKPTEPKPTEPKPTEPKPTEPKPTEPKPTEPKPTEPKPTEPKPTEPKPTTPADTSNPETGDSFNALLLVLLFVASTAGIILLVKHKKGIRIVCLLLCATMLLSMVPANAFATDANTATITADKTITVDGNKYTVKVNVTVPSDELSSTCVVSFNTNGGTAVESQTINKGATASIPNSPEKEGFAFVGWYVDAELTATFDFSAPVNKSCTIYARWVDIVDTTDTDADGLTDKVEEFYNTDPVKADTDDDGLNDYIEITVFGYDPLKADTDNNGTTDNLEDFDQDGINNKVELELGTDPRTTDTDGDELSDKDEIDTYNTDPTKEDTDGDGANDGWEIKNNFDPLVANASFDVEVKTQQTLADESVIASVSMEAEGTQAATLSVSPVNDDAVALLSNSVPGYLGKAYDFSTDGNITKATITFEYDTSLGSISDEFQPRIYYFNEEKGTLEELENQTVTDGKVSVEVPHFSKYILLNKVEFDKVWEAEIKPPLSSENPENEATLDIVFVIDYSLSMDENDPYQLFKTLSEEFVNKLRDGKDKAGAVKFIRRATLVSALTTDKESVITAINGIRYDNGYGTYSGTDGSAGIKMALDQMAASDSEYQYIVFITDGEDNGYSYSYDSLIATANESNVTIYAVGMGSASESVLKKVSSQTGGKYYHATTGVSVDDLINLDDVFEDIEAETIDLTTDSNGDKIPDYYNNLIKEGILRLSNGSDQFAGIDFNEKADYDGDGVLNGEELRIVQSGTAVYMEMVSDPTRSDTDGDGYNDEVDFNPLKEYKTPIILLHGWNSNSSCFGVNTAIHDGDNSHYDHDKNGKPDDTSISGLNYTSPANQQIAEGSFKEDRLGAYLEKQGYERNKNLYAFNYPNQDMVQYNAGKLKDYIANLIKLAKENPESQTTDKYSLYATKEDFKDDNIQFILIGHSMGGLVSRYYVENLGTEYVEKIITIDTPHYGSGLGNAADKLDIAKLAGYFNPAVFDLDTKSTLYGGNEKSWDWSIIAHRDTEYAINNQSPALNGNKNSNVKYYAIAGYNVGGVSEIKQLAPLLKNSLENGEAFSFDFARLVANKESFKQSINSTLNSLSMSYFGQGSVLDLGDSDGDNTVDYMSQFAVRFGGNYDYQDLEKTTLVLATGFSLTNPYHNAIHKESLMHQAVGVYIND